ncbi:hypothetical protein [Stratiformator vulcanicus]|uniref:Uncharacterized protein n=1 Tax=Stratiformator vulcanicus TaxID=2527980 RepID=A0A517R7L0_9PLAN|nr:hypothetical protein [Stratiformator vulcanicus]QDT39874.1 hypothetical protein Pan189_42860 [Stratiformator vulcanicus]
MPSLSNRDQSAGCFAIAVLFGSAMIFAATGLQYAILFFGTGRHGVVAMIFLMIATPFAISGEAARRWRRHRVKRGDEVQSNEKP